MSIKTEEGLNASIGRHLWACVAIGVLLIGGLGGWSAFAVVDSAVMAPATVVVEASRKRVQHNDGGIVSAILVKNGNKVAQGDVLIQLDGTQIDTEIATLEERWLSRLLRQKRLLAERSNQKTLKLSASILGRAAQDQRFAEKIRTQEDLLRSRIELRHGHRQQLRQRMGQHNREVQSLIKVRTFTESELAVLDEEIAGLDRLKSRNLVRVSRYNRLKRERAVKAGNLWRTVAQIDQVKGKVSDIELKLTELDFKERTEILQELEQVETEIGQLDEQLIAARDRRKRLDIRASDNGVVHQLSVHTVGGVVSASDTLAYVVPSDSRLVVDAKLATVDRDQVSEGKQARIRFTAFSQRTTPEISGHVVHVASDQSQSQPDQPPFYSVRIAIDPDQSMDVLDQAIKPGMPAEVLIIGNRRTILSYVAKPLVDQFTRAFREQ